MKVAIVGAGKMGRWFTKFFTEEGVSVVVSDIDEEKSAKIRNEFGVATANKADAIKEAEWVLIAVPVKDFEDVTREIRPYVRPEQIIMDICSIKEFPVRIMHDHLKTGVTLGTHPIFGPGAKNIRNQGFILTPTTTKEKEFADDFKKWLEKRGAEVFLMSPQEHDELMSVVLGLPHFIGLVVCDTLLSYSNFAQTKKVAGTTYKMLLTLAEAVASEKAEFYADLQMRLPKTEEIETLFWEKSQEWLDIVRKKDRVRFATKMKAIQTKLERIDPNYTKSYETMHELFDNVHL